MATSEIQTSADGSKTLSAEPGSAAPATEAGPVRLHIQLDDSVRSPFDPAGSSKFDIVLSPEDKRLLTPGDAASAWPCAKIGPTQLSLLSFVAELNDAELGLLRDGLRQIALEFQAAAEFRRLFQRHFNPVIDELVAAS